MNINISPIKPWVFKLSFRNSATMKAWFTIYLHSTPHSFNGYEERKFENIKSLPIDGFVWRCGSLGLQEVEAAEAS